MERYIHPVIFGEWLKIRRKALDLTQAELAQRAGCSVHALRKIESGERRPSKQLAGLIANSIEIPAEQRSVFVQVARGELHLDRLGSPYLETHPAGIKTPQIPANRINIPAAPTQLIGRQQELAILDQLLLDPQCRMVTITGPGGIGKTRLAIEAAAL
ncbi:MAG: helix-turn-helix domain-containing protein, partial [Candidatus Thorarchaeota archaeon]